jgi:hypothetical protein
MKKLVLSLVIAGFGFLGSNAVAQEVTSGAKIDFKKEVHDYGTIEQGADGTCEFEFKNTGTQPLIIQSAKGSCGCTVPSYPQAPIAPGQSATIKVKYDTNRVGPINKSVTITSNASNEPTKIVRIKDNVNAGPQGGAPVNNAGAPNAN